MTTSTREYGLCTEKFVAEVTYELGTTCFGYGETDEKAVTEALREGFGAIEQILIFCDSGKTKVRRVLGSSMTVKIYEAFVAA